MTEKICSIYCVAFLTVLHTVIGSVLTFLCKRVKNSYINNVVYRCATKSFSTLRNLKPIGLLHRRAMQWNGACLYKIKKCVRLHGHRICFHLWVARVQVNTETFLVEYTHLKIQFKISTTFSSIQNICSIVLHKIPKLNAKLNFQNKSRFQF